MPATIVNTHEAKSRLSELLRLVERGEEVILARNGTMIAKLIPWPSQQRPRKPGSWAGRVHDHDDLVGSDADVVAMFDESDPIPRTHRES
jgi:prevent-host-death family protein